MLKDRLTADMNPVSFPFGVGGLLPYAGCLDDSGKRSDVAFKKFEAKEVPVAVFGTVEGPP